MILSNNSVVKGEHLWKYLGQNIYILQNEEEIENWERIFSVKNTMTYEEELTSKLSNLLSINATFMKMVGNVTKEKNPHDSTFFRQTALEQCGGENPQVTSRSSCLLGPPSWALTGRGTCFSQQSAVHMMVWTSRLGHKKPGCSV